VLASVGAFLWFRMADPLPMDKTDVARARQVFERFRQACCADAGALWGVSLLCPVILVDQESREAVASYPDPEGQLAPEGELFVGHIPPDLPIANTAQDWAGMRWVMIVWQTLPDDPRAAVRLLAHEAFHWARRSWGSPGRTRSGAMPISTISKGVTGSSLSGAPW